jgi:hypothetical protein
MTATAFGEGLMLDAILDGPFWISLHTGLPTGGNEVAGGGYARVESDNTEFTRVGSEPIVASNNVVLEFPSASAQWVAGANLTHFAIWDAATGGNMRARDPLTTPKAVDIYDVVRFPVGTLVVSAE